MRILEIFVVIPLKYNAYRIDNLLSILLFGVSRTYCNKYISIGLLLVNNKECYFFSEKIFYRDVLLFYVYENLCFFDKKVYFDITYKDKYILIINKNKNFVMFPSKQYTIYDFFNSLTIISIHFYLLPRFGLVHRLDKDTTGLFILAITLDSFYYLRSLFKLKKIKRIYEAVVVGNVSSSVFIDFPLKNFKCRTLPNLYGKDAFTFFEVLKSFKGYMYIRISLFTGRKHQIRAHMNYEGHSIIGDKIYSSQLLLDDFFLNNFPRQALHAKELLFLHPNNKRIFHCFINLPYDINMLLYFLNKFYLNLLI